MAGFWDNIGNALYNWFGIGSFTPTGNAPMPMQNVPAPQVFQGAYTENLSTPSFSVTPIDANYVTPAPPINPILAAAANLGTRIGGYSMPRRGQIDPVTQKILADCSYYVGSSLKNANIDVGDLRNFNTTTMPKILTPDKGWEYHEGTEGVGPGDVLWYPAGFRGNSVGHTAIMGDNGKLHQVVNGGRIKGYWGNDTRVNPYKGYFRYTNPATAPSLASSGSNTPAEPVRMEGTSAGNIFERNNPLADDWIMNMAMNQIAKNNPYAAPYARFLSWG